MHVKTQREFTSVSQSIYARHFRHFTMYQLTLCKIPHTSLRSDFRFPAIELWNHISIVPELIQSCFKRIRSVSGYNQSISGKAISPTGVRSYQYHTCGTNSTTVFTVVCSCGIMEYSTLTTRTGDASAASAHNDLRSWVRWKRRASNVTLVYEDKRCQRIRLRHNT